MTEKDLAKMLEILEPYFKKKFEKETGVSKTVKMLNAVIDNRIANDHGRYVVHTPDSPKATFIVTNPNPAITYEKGDIVQLIYTDTLKSAQIFSRYET